MRARRSAAAARLRKLLVRAREGVRRLLPARAARALDRAARFRLRRPTVREALFGVAILLLLLWVAWERCGMRGCPNVERLASYQPGGASVLLDRAGRPFADLAPVERAVVSLDSLPAYVADAFIAVEDKRFYQHTGVDWRRVVGAALADLRARGFVQGFSTITMQLARNVFPDRLPGARRTLKRKLLEIRVAREIEGKFSKSEILELYLNHIYFGRGAYGIEAAAQHYFRRPARRLTLAQAALLAALPKSPSTYDPRRYAERARGRRNLVLALMAEQGRVHAEEAESARAARLGVRREPPPRQEPAGLGPYFAEVVRRELEDRFGDLVYTAPLRIRTSLDRRFQQAAEEELSRQLRAIEAGAFGRFHGPRYRRELEAGAEITDYLQGSVLVLDASTGDVLALVGGRDFRHSQFDRATQAWRQAGSAFKPFVYAAALEDGVAPSQHIADAPLRFELEGGEVWEPQNFSGEFEGSVTVRQALVRSKNVPTIRLAAEVGTDDVARVARRAGVRSRLPRVPSLAIGTAAVTPLELTSAYTAFASLGETVRPRLVQRIEDAQGRVVWEAGEPERRRVLEPAVAYLLTDMLREAVDHGTATAVRRAGFRGPAAGKTGTTNEGTDVWYVGYTPELVASVWIGFDRPRPILERATGGRLAAPVWGRLMRRIYQGRERPKPWQAPEDIIELRVDPRTGYVLREGCRPEAGAAVQELFVRGMEPAARCPRGGPGTEQRGLFERAFAWLGRLWGRVERWAAAHFGREEAVAPRRRSRYLGAPRLPRADEVPEPQVQVEPPDLEPIIIIPDIEPLVPETSAVEEPLQEPDTTPSPPAPGDTILILTPTDSGIVLERAVGRHRRP